MSNKAAVSTILSIDRLIHEPARFVIMMHLYVVEEADFVLLARQTGLSAGNLSSHMSKLEDAGYVRVKKSFAGKRPQTTFRLSQEGRTAFDDYRKTVGQVLHLAGDTPPTDR